MKAKRSAAPRVRTPGFDDAMTLGMMLRAALSDAPSAPIEADELGDDLEQVGRDFVSAVMFGNESLLVAELGHLMAGVVRLVPREFARGCHVATMQILVAPEARGRRIGTLLREAGLAEAFGPRRFERVEMHIASHDLALERLMAGDARRWSLERVERRGTWVDGRFRDVGVWVVDHKTLPRS